jgi:hypothetical protein
VPQAESPPTIARGSRRGWGNFKTRPADAVNETYANVISTRIILHESVEEADKVLRHASKGVL